MISGPIPSPRATVIGVFFDIRRKELRFSTLRSTPNPPLEPRRNQKYSRPMRLVLLLWLLAALVPALQAQEIILLSGGPAVRLL